MKLTRIFPLLLAIGLVIPTVAVAEAPGTIEWKAHNDKYEAHGKFQKWQFTRVTIPDGNLEKGVVEFEIDMASVWEKADALAEHLRQADFFNVEKYTTATVKIDRVKKTGENSYDGIATVTLHGHTDEVPISFTASGDSPIAIEGTATLNRIKFGIGSAEDGITQDVEVMISTELKG
ncbi:MAG: YceI family protein [Acidobacteriota bacterium]